MVPAREVLKTSTSAFHTQFLEVVRSAVFLCLQYWHGSTVVQ